MTLRNIFFFVSIGKSAVAAMGFALALMGVFELALMSDSGSWFNEHVVGAMEPITLGFGVVGALFGAVMSLIAAR